MNNLHLNTRDQVRKAVARMCQSLGCEELVPDLYEVMLQHWRQSAENAPDDVSTWINLWMAERCDVIDKNDLHVFSPTQLLWDDYRKWMLGKGKKSASYVAFRQNLMAKQFEAARRRHWAYDNPRAGFTGIQLAHDDGGVV